MFSLARPRSRIARLLCAAFAGVLLLWLADRLWPLPMPADDLARVVLAEDGTPLWRFADAEGVWRYPVTLDQVSPYYLEALLTYEDRWFYRHPGVNPLALGRAAWQNLTGGRVLSGGSTLSMQVARLLDPHSRTLPGKLRQVWRTAQLEWHLSKRQILELYLNRAPFGGTLQGVAAASWAYLGKSPLQLTPAEAALLAVLPQAPSRLRPDRHPERARLARDKVLQRLGEYQVWPQQRIAEAQEEPLLLAPRQEPALAPLLARRLNRADSPPLIHTTLDAALQRRLEDLLLGWRARLPERTSAAILVVESQTMAVRAYLGSVDLGDERRFGHVDMITALRSPGSTLKPFLYGMAMDDGLIHSESLLQDVPRRYGDYRPGNFSMGFSGPVAASSALALSLNLPAVQLLEAYGPKRFAAQMRMGGMPLSLPMAAEPNLSLILGGAGSRLEDLVSGYSAFARDGMSAPLRLQPDAPLVERRLLSPGSAWIIRRILSGQARPDRDPHAELVQRPQLAWKTGTSYGFRDAWSIGVGPRYLIGIWIGRPDGTPVPGQFGLASAAPLMLQVHDVLSNRDSQRGIAPPGAGSAGQRRGGGGLLAAGPAHGTHRPQLPAPALCLDPGQHHAADPARAGPAPGCGAAGEGVGECPGPAGGCSLCGGRATRHRAVAGTTGPVVAAPGAARGALAGHRPELPAAGTGQCRAVVGGGYTPGRPVASSRHQPRCPAPERFGAGWRRPALVVPQRRTLGRDHSPGGAGREPGGGGALRAQRAGCQRADRAGRVPGQRLTPHP